MPARPRIEPPVGKSGPGTISISSVERHVRMVDQRDAGVDDLAEIVRRDIGRHADGDAAGAIDQQIGETRRQDRRLPLLAVVIGLEIDRVVIDVLDQRQRRAARGAIRCSAWPPRGRRPPSRNCPARRSAAGSSRRAAPCAPARRRSPRRRGDDIYPSLRRRCAPISHRTGRAGNCFPASNRGCADAPASGRRGRRAARGSRSRSSRKRDRSSSSRR